MADIKYLNIDNSVLVLSDMQRVFKTEPFTHATKSLIDIDLFVSKLAEGIIKANLDLNSAYIITTLDNINSFFIRFGKTTNNETVHQSDIIFYKFVTKDEIKNEDKRLYRLLSSKSIDINIQKITITEDIDFTKLYILSNADKVNFPLLNKEQEKIVTQENNNVLVQGVAGSGKTNICIDRIVYAATRRYKGKILYSTYSHALLEDTKTKVILFRNNIKSLLDKWNENKIVFVGHNKKKAIENKLGLWLDVDDEKGIKNALKDILDFLENRVDYMMIEDIYNKMFNTNVEFVSESYFINTYLKNIRNYNLKSNIDKIKYIAQEVIYKEIYGLINGSAKDVNNLDKLTQDEYIELRKESFTKQEAQIIYMIAQDYYKHLADSHKIDNNIASRAIIEKIKDKYSLVVLDEVQDFTQINLVMFEKMAFKMFCVGDALQMINPAYFNFAYLKRLMFDEKYINVLELTNNYRNNKKIERIIDNLSELNIEQFGTHSFVLRGKSIDDDMQSKTVYVNDGNFMQLLSGKAYADVTIVVNSQEKKQELRKILPKQEILTISEIKGLERSFIILLDVLSDNSTKWDTLNRTIISKKKAEENSVYRYYFNLFYVGLTRAKQNVFVVERKVVSLFNNFFEKNFDIKNNKEAFNILDTIASKVDLDRQEVLERIEEFIKHEQYDNARFITQKLDKVEEKMQLAKIDIFEKYVRRGQHREAGVELWKVGLLEDAKFQFKLSQDDKLIDLIDACENNGSKLEYDIVEFYDEVKGNEVARQIIIDTLKEDVENIKSSQKEIIDSLKARRRQHGSK